MSQLAVISNVDSRRNRKGGLAAVNNVAETFAVPHQVIHGATGLDDALQILAGEAPDILVINGGDGTVDMVITALKNGNRFETVPRLALLKGGTTNMTHETVGLTAKPHVALKKLCRGWRPPVCEHPPLIVSLNDKSPRYGFFLGVNGIPRLIQATQNNFYAKGASGFAGQILTLAGLILGRDKRGLLAPQTLSRAMDDDTFHTGQIRALTVTTLDRLLLGIQTTRNASHKAAVLCVDQKADNIPRLLWRIYKGQDGDDITRSETDKIQLKGRFPWTLDGQIYETSNDDDILTIQTGTPLFFLSDVKS